MTKKRVFSLATIWLCVVISAYFASVQLTQQLTMQDAAVLVDRYAVWVLAAYVIVISMRGLLFMPTMPLILLCAALAPAWIAFAATFIGTVISAILVTGVVNRLLSANPEAGFDARKWRRAKIWLNRYGVTAVVSWAFFPFVYTEAIVYAAAYTGMRRRKIVIATAIGECFLIILLVIAGQRGIQFIQQGF